MSLMHLSPWPFYPPPKFLWTNTTTYSLLIALLNLQWLTPSYLPHKNLTPWTSIDQIWSPLLALFCWLPLMILASQNHLQHEPLNMKTNLYLHPHYSSTLYHPSILNHSTNIILHLIWSNPNPNSHLNFPLS